MDNNLTIKNNEFPKFLNQLAIDLTNYYFRKLNKPFKINNKLQGRGYDPVTTCDKAFEKFIRAKISKKFNEHENIDEENGYKKTKREIRWVID